MNGSAAPSLSETDPAALGTPGPSELDASCRWPVLYLFAAGIGWLVLAGVLGLIASLKFHQPDLLVESAWLTYGRVHPAALNALVYGFAAQTGLAVALWMLCRLGQTRLVGPGVAVLGAGVWNIAVVLGVAAILFGDSTGIEWLEMPRYAASVLFVAYLLLGTCALLTFRQRRPRRLYPSQWFLLAALFWFPWIYSTANLLLVVVPVRGMVQACVHGWYVHNLQTIFLGFLGLATLTYLIPKLAGRPLHSAPLAIFAFWGLAWFGSWGGIHADAPLPAWISSVSTVFTMLSSAPLLAMWLNLWKTLAGDPAVKTNPSLRLAAFSANGFLITGLMTAVGSHGSVNALLHFTLFDTARTQALLYSFVATAVFGSIYHILPRLLAAEPPSPRLVKVHVQGVTWGIMISVSALAVGGVYQGLKLNDASVAFGEVTQTMLVFYRLSTLGDTLLLVGNVALAANGAWWLARWCGAVCCPRWRHWTRAAPGTEPAEAKA